jgi:hypothetical protein
MEFSSAGWGTAGARPQGTARDNPGHPRAYRRGRSPARTPSSWTRPGAMPSMACKRSGVQIPSAPPHRSRSEPRAHLAPLLGATRLPDSCHPRATRCWRWALREGRCGLDQLVQGGGEGGVPAGHHVLVAQGGGRGVPQVVEAEPSRPTARVAGRRTPARAPPSRQRLGTSRTRPRRRNPRDGSADTGGWFGGARWVIHRTTVTCVRLPTRRSASGGVGRSLIERAEASS